MAVGADKRPLRGRNLILFAVVAVLWLGADIATKAYFNGFPAGSVVAGPFLGLVQFRVAHNTGAAWGMFGDSTFALGVLSLAVCAALTAYLILVSRRASVIEVLGGALRSGLHRHHLHQLPHVQRGRHRRYLRLRAVLRGYAVVYARRRRLDCHGRPGSRPWRGG